MRVPQWAVWKGVLSVPFVPRPVFPHIARLSNSVGGAWLREQPLSPAVAMSSLWLSAWASGVWHHEQVLKREKAGPCRFLLCLGAARWLPLSLGTRPGWLSLGGSILEPGPGQESRVSPPGEAHAARCLDVCGGPPGRAGSPSSPDRQSSPWSASCCQSRRHLVFPSARVCV